MLLVEKIFKNRWRKRSSNICKQLPLEARDFPLLQEYLDTLLSHTILLHIKNVNWSQKYSLNIKAQTNLGYMNANKIEVTNMLTYQKQGIASGVLWSNITKNRCQAHDLQLGSLKCHQDCHAIICYLQRELQSRLGNHTIKFKNHFSPTKQKKSELYYSRI